MKRKFMGLLALAVGVLTLVSCKKDEEERQMVFSASMEQGSQKTALDSDGETINWSEKDSISLFATGASTLSNVRCTTSVGGTTVTDFTGTISGSGPYVAVYPYNAGISYDKTNERPLKGVVIPTTQVATPGGFDPKANVMVAKSGNTSLEFKNVCAYIKIITTESYNCIRVAAKDTNIKLSGTFDVKWACDTPSATATNGRNYVDLVPNDGSTVVAGTYLIAVAPATLLHGFSIVCVATNGTKVKTKSASVTFKRRYVANYGTLRNMTTTSYQAVDLGLSVKWAQMNVGATSETDLGFYFAWGETKPKFDYSWSTYKYGNYTDQTQTYSLTKYVHDNTHGTVDNLNSLDNADDAAYVNWGSDWRMPTNDEFQALISSCTLTWHSNYNSSGVSGFVVSGNSNSIFLPAASRYNGNVLDNTTMKALYWTSSISKNGNGAIWDPDALYFEGNGENRNMAGNWRPYGLLVRAVKEN